MSAATKAQCAALIEKAKRWALAHPGEEYRKTVIYDEDRLACVSRWFYEEACVESEYFGELFAIKEAGRPVYASLEVAR